MTPRLASLICTAFILGLFHLENKRRKVSLAVWLPSIWVFILGSKPISLWFGGDAYSGEENYVEGSPFDRLFFMSLIAAAWVVVFRRGVNWSVFFRSNRWLGIYFGYLCISVIWSDYPFVSFKRWIKDFGNVAMVLVVLTEENPLDAVKSLVARCTYLLIPLSVLLIKYYPDLGRYYDAWTYQPHYGGVTTDKNLLGMTLFFCALSAFWMLLEAWSVKKAERNKYEIGGFALLLAMTVWLLIKAQSSTALACSVLGSTIMVGVRMPVIRSKVERLGMFCMGTVAIVLILNTVIDVTGVLVTILGRDLTFTGRTDIWHAVLREDINPIFGTGFYSFWMGDRATKLSETYHYLLNEAHNGYIETYLNSGFLGVLLLGMVLFTAVRSIQREVTAGSNFGAVKLAFVLANVIYNITEAAFDRLDLLWFGLLLMIVNYPCAEESGAFHAPISEAEAGPAQAGNQEPSTADAVCSGSNA